MSGYYQFLPELCGFPEMNIEVELEVEYGYTPAGGDGWEEPRYDAEVEIVKFTAMLHPDLTDCEKALHEAVAKFYNDNEKMDMSHLEEAIIMDLES